MCSFWASLALFVLSYRRGYSGNFKIRLLLKRLNTGQFYHFYQTHFRNLYDGYLDVLIILLLKFVQKKETSKVYDKEEL